MTEQQSIPTPPWLRAAADQRLALMLETLGGRLPPNPGFVMMTLTELDEGATPADYDRWERTCDRCGRYCPDSERFLSGMVPTDVNGVQVLMAWGACPGCVEVP